MTTPKPLVYVYPPGGHQLLENKKRDQRKCSFLKRIRIQGTLQSIDKWFIQCDKNMNSI